MNETTQMEEQFDRVDLENAKAQWFAIGVLFGVAVMTGVMLLLSWLG